MGDIIELHGDSDSGGMTLSGLVDLSREVGKNTSDIEQLKTQTGDLDKLRTEVGEIKTNIRLTGQKLDQLAQTDLRIEKILESIISGTSTFRYWLWGAVGGICLCIFVTLQFGLSLTEKNQATLEINLQKQISEGDKRHSKNYKGIFDQIQELNRHINTRRNE